MSLTPKQQLEQVNNPNLLSILSTIQGLPNQQNIVIDSILYKEDLNLISRTFAENIQISTLPCNFYKGGAAIYRDELHIICQGASGGVYHYKFDGTSWTKVSTVPFTINVSHNPRVVVLDDALHVFTNTIHYKWDGTSWTEISTLPFSFKYGDAVVLRNEIHILGSDSSLSPGTAYHYKFDGTSWTEVSTLPYLFNHGGACVLNDEIHILGSDVDDYASYHYKFDGTSWTEVSTLPFKYENGDTALLNNKIHILGSNYSSVQYQRHYEFDGTAWKSVGELPYIFYGGGAAVEWNNRIYIMGGGNENYYTNHYEVCHTVYEREVV